MDSPIHEPLFPLVFFVKLAVVPRVTLENWMRSGALAPKKSGPTNFFSIADLLKTEIMARLNRQFGTPPQVAASAADAIIAMELKYLSVAVFDPEADFSLIEKYFVDRGAGGAMVVSKDKCEYDDILLEIPIGALARVVEEKVRIYLMWGQSGLDRLIGKLDDYIAARRGPEK